MSYILDHNVVNSTHDIVSIVVDYIRKTSISPGKYIYQYPSKMSIYFGEVIVNRAI